MLYFFLERIALWYDVLGRLGETCPDNMHVPFVSIVPGCTFFEPAVQERHRRTCAIQMTTTPNPKRKIEKDSCRTR